MARLSTSDLQEWRAYSRLDPFGNERLDYHAAMITCAVANAFRGKDDDPVEIQDVMPMFGLDEGEREKHEKRRKAEKMREKLHRAVG